MSQNLVIVESPAKAKTIEKFLGKGYTVKSSFGHIRDLPSKGMSIDVDNNFEPKYEISTDKKKVVAELKKAAKSADTVWLASDEDREGEAIAWHLVEALKLPAKSTKRIVFHEITKPAIEAAIKKPRSVDINLVDAQQARRVLDRLVGYELSPVLWKKIQRGLSAGRVQSVAVRLIVEREREITAFSSQATYKVSAIFTDSEGRQIEAQMAEKLSSADAAEALLESLKTASFKIEDIAKTPSTRSPSAPFTTSTLQQEASRKLGFSVKQTMTLAQRLYESGHITYMRTDSTNLSNVAIKSISDFVTKHYGAKALKVRAFKTKISGAQEAHEAIRPTNPMKQAAGEDDRQKKLYKLIWQRTVASQMVEAQIAKTQITVVPVSNKSVAFLAKGEIITDPGWMSVFPQNFKETELPDLKPDDALDCQEITARQTFSRPPARYTEASLVRKLEEMGIGRPSTYAPTISTIQDRGYVVKGDSDGQSREVTLLTLKDGSVKRKQEAENYGADKNKLLPTDIAGVVTDFLVKNFEDVLDYEFTAGIENEFDDIAQGKKKWQAVIKRFYGEFAKDLKKVEGVEREEAAGHRELGTDPKDGKPILARVGRYGPMLQKGRASDDEKPAFAPLPEGASLETVTLEEALPMFKLPRQVGKSDDGEDIVAAIGRFGPYVRMGSLFVSIKGHDPLTIELDEAKKLIAAKQKESAEKLIKEFDNSPVKVLNGRYGPYITDGKKNARIPKDQKPESVTLKIAEDLLKTAPARRSRGRRS